MIKIIIGLMVAGLVGASAYTYVSRPIALPSNTMSETTESDTGSSVSGDSGTSEARNASVLASASTTINANVGVAVNGGSIKNYSITSGSIAEFNIFEVLSGKDFTVVGTSPNVTGFIAFNSTAPEKSVISDIKINARTFKTESGGRDTAIARFILKSEDPKNEFIVFSPTSIDSVNTSKSDSNNIYTAFVTGNLTIAGVTKVAKFNVKATESATGFNVTGEGKIKKGDFGIIVPEVPFVAKVGEEITLKINAIVK